MKASTRVGVGLTLLVAGGGCAGVSQRKFRPQGSIAPKLAPLYVHVVDTNLFRGEISRGGRTLSEYSVQVTQDRADETRYLIKRDLQENVFDPAGRRRGHIVFKVTRTQGMEHWWAFPTAFSLFAVNLVGFPFNASTTTVTLDVRVLDADHAELARYSVVGKGTGYIAMYWGYSPAASVQASSADATRAAMKDLKGRLQADAARINAKLAPTNAGVLQRQAEFFSREVAASVEARKLWRVKAPKGNGRRSVRTHTA